MTPMLLPAASDQRSSEGLKGKRRTILGGARTKPLTRRDILFSGPPSRAVQTAKTAPRQAGQPPFSERPGIHLANPPLVKTTLFATLIFCLASVLNADDDCETKWTKLEKGLDYRAITCIGETDALDVHVVRVDLDEWSLNTAVVDRGTARGIAESKDAAFAINTNFFDKARKPMGLIVRSGEEVREPRESTWQSIFLVDRSDRARIILPDSWNKYSDEAKVGVQAGPRLVVDGHVSKATNNYRAERVGVCIQPDGDLLFFATPRDRKLHVREMARIAQRAEKEGGLNCRNAMLFDGGHSVNFFVEGEDKKVSVSNGRVPVFVYATKR